MERKGLSHAEAGRLGGYARAAVMTRKQRIFQAKMAHAKRKSRNGRPRGSSGRCGHCKMPGHYRTTCPYLLTIPKPGMTLAEASRETS